MTGFQGHRLHHTQPRESLCTAAQNRLEELELEDLGDLFRFREGATLRFWGYEIDGIFYALWWDPNHKVYETEPN
jgi:hypothetical protein